MSDGVPIGPVVGRTGLTLTLQNTMNQTHDSVDWQDAADRIVALLPYGDDVYAYARAHRILQAIFALEGS